MKNKNYAEKRNNSELSCTRKRAIGLFFDFLVWYGVYFIMLIMFFITKYGAPEVSGDLAYYKNCFDGIIKSPLFITLYLSFIVSWEIIIPILTEGQSFFKQKYNIKVLVENKKNIKLTLAIRGIIKLIVLNPYGIIAYVLGSIISMDAVNIISNITTILFIVCIVCVILGKNALYDRILGTRVVLAK